MSRRKEIALVAAGILAGIAVSGPATQAAVGLMANPSSQKFYINEQRIPIAADHISGLGNVLRTVLGDIDGAVRVFAECGGGGLAGGRGWCRCGHLRFIGLVRVDGDGVGPGVIGDAEVHRLSDVPELHVVAAVDLVGFQGDALLVDVEFLAAGPQAGDVVRCDDGTNYTITDVSRYDKNYFADGPAVCR